MAKNASNSARPCASHAGTGSANKMGFAADTPLSKHEVGTAAEQRPSAEEEKDAAELEEGQER